MAADARDTNGLPNQAIRVVETGRVGQVWLVEVDHQALLAKVVDPMRAAVAVVGLLLAFVGNADLVENRLTTRSDRIEVLLLQFIGELLQSDAALG